MKTIKVSEATNIQLDWLVAKCEGAMPQISWDKRLYGAIGDTFDYTTDWAQGGPIIEREHITTRHIGMSIQGQIWDAAIGDGDEHEGPTLLTAAMRCFVISKLGDEVEVPDELA